MKKLCKEKCRLVLSILACLTSSTVFSESSLTKGHFVFNFGGYIGSQGQSQQINIQDLIGDTFTLDDRHYQSYLLGLGYFIDGKKLGCANMSYGVNVFYLAPTSVSGNVIQENLFNNLSYRYHIANYPIYLMAKSTIDWKPMLAFTMDIGIGPNIMKTYDFQEGSLDGVTLPDSPFSSNTTTTLSATIGAGIKINNVFGEVPLEIGYRFFYLGQGYFKIGNPQVLNKLKTGNVYANAIIFSIST